MTDPDQQFRRIAIVVGTIIVVSTLGLLGWLSVEMAAQSENLDPAYWIVFIFLLMLLFTAIRIIVNMLANR